MKIYDISQEVFSSKVFPGDPVPKKESLSRIVDREICNLSAFYMCAHNGTHVDAPYHFFEEGKKIDEMPLENFVGEAYVAYHEGVVTAEAAAEIMKKAEKTDSNAAKRILIKGDAVVSFEAAKVFAKAGILLLGNESQTVGSKDELMDVHMKLLGAGVVLLEGIRLGEVPEGVYFLNAAPLNLGGGDGAPCRAILIEG